MKTFIIVLVAYLALLSPVAAQDYVCERSILGCYTRYVGPVDKAAAQAYLEDAKRVSAAIVDNYPQIQSVSYELSTGQMIIQAKEDQRVGDYTLQRIGDMVNDNRLYVTSLRVLDSSLRWELNSARILRLNGGKSRFFALNELMVSR